MQEIGSYNRHKEYFCIDGSEKFLDYFFSYSYEENKGYRQNNRYLGNNVLYNMAIHPADFFDFEFSFGYHKDYYGMPGAIYGSNISSDGRTTTNNPNDKAKTEDYFFTWNPIIYLDKENTETQFSCFTTYRNRKTKTKNWGLMYDNHDIVSFEIKPKIESKLTYYDEKIDNKLILGVDVFSGKDNIASGVEGDAPSLVDIQKTTVGVYLFDKILIDKRFILNSGVRGDFAKYIFDQTSPSFFKRTRYLSEVAVDVGIGYKYNNKSQLYFDYQRSYRYPVTDEFFMAAYSFFGVQHSAEFNTDLKPQSANNFEIGIKDNSFENIKFNADYFFINTKNEIFLDPDPDRNKGTNESQNVNYPSTFKHGLELEINAKVFDYLSTFLNYTYQKAVFKKGAYSGKDFPLVPNNKISFGFDIMPTEGLNINIINNYVSERYFSNDMNNEFSKLKSYFTTDLNIMFKVKELYIAGGIKNLFGFKYNSNGVSNFNNGNQNFYPAPERRFELTVSAKF